MFKIPIGSDKFFNEIHPKLKPVETVIKGVYIGGACQGPKNVSESVQSSLSGAAKINALLKGSTVSLDPIVARVNADACTWCGKCETVCEYTAIREMEVDGKHIAAVNEAICSGCGICAPICPVNAIEVAQFTDVEIESMIDGFMMITEVQKSDATVEKTEVKEIQGMKKLPQLWTKILEQMNGGKKTIPEIAAELNVDKEVITYHLMTMNKYGVVVPDGLDDDDAYFYYKIKNQ
jgi:ferredoxin